MNEKGSIRNAVIAAVLILIAMTLIGCAGGSFTKLVQQHGTGNDAYELRSPAKIATEIGSFSIPAGIDEDIFSNLKIALAGSVLSNPVSRKVGAVPQGDSGLVTDLAYNQGTGEFTWSYVNIGDYDLSGEVGVPDITPIAQNYLAAATPGTLLGWIDGDDSGEVGISDITPIANNYLNAVIGYSVLTCATETGTFNEIARVTLEDAKAALPVGSEYPVTFVIPTSAMMLGWVAVQPYDGNDNLGEMSASVEMAVGENPPVISNVSPQGGVEGDDVTFSASVTGTPPMTFAWDFGGGATPDTSSAVSPQVTLGADGSYDASLTVTNSFGNDSYDFTLTVSQQGLETPAIVTDATPIEGTEGETITFNASVTGTEPISFNWDFGGGATPDTSTERSPEVTLGTPGTYSASVTVQNTFGPASEFDFTLTVNPAIILDPHVDIDNWTSYILEDSENYGKFSATAIIDGKPAIVYTRDDRKWVKYAYSTVTNPTSPSDWVTSSISEDTARGGQLGIAEIQGLPCVVFMATTDQDAYFGYATSTTPDDVSDWIIHEPDIESLAEPSLAVVGMSAIMAYRTAGSVRFAQSISAFNPPALPADWQYYDIATGDQYEYPYVANIGGNPALSYQRKDSGWNEQWYAYAANDLPSETDWTAVKVDDSMKNSGINARLVDIGGLPVLAYQNIDDDQFNEFLVVARSSSAAPTAGNWSKVTILDEYQTDFGQGLGMCVVNDRPFISSHYTFGGGQGKLLASYPTVDAPVSVGDWQSSELEIAPDYFINEATSPLTLPDGGVIIVFRASVGLKVAYYTAP